MLFGAFVQGKSAVENQACNSLRVLGGMTRIVSCVLAWTLITCPSTFEVPLRCWQMREEHRLWPLDLADISPMSPVPPQPVCCSHHHKNVFTGRMGAASIPQGQGAASVFPPSCFTLMMLLCAWWIISKRVSLMLKLKVGEPSSNSSPYHSIFQSTKVHGLFLLEMVELQ